MHRDLVALLRLAIALDLVGDFNVEVGGGGADSQSGDDAKDGGSLHSGDVMQYNAVNKGRGGFA